MDGDMKLGIGVALNEATLLGAEVSRERRMAAITLAVLSLPSDGGPAPEDSRVSLVLAPVGRVVASLRHSRWDDDSAPPVPFSLAELLATVQSFGGLPVYGWEFIDIAEGFERWSGRLSLDERLGEGGDTHSITLFQEGNDRHLDLRIWFDRLQVFRPDHTEIQLEEFMAGGKRWWDGLYSGDSRTGQAGIFPGGTPLPKHAGPPRDGPAGGSIIES